MVDMFHRLAPGYDRVNRFISLGGDLRWRRRAAAEALKGQPGLVLDLATGTGEMAKALERQGCTVVGLDLCPSMMALARSKVGRWAALLQGHALELPFKGESFDAVSIAFALRDLPNLPGVFNECYRVLRLGGRLICLELSQPHRYIGAMLYRFYMNRVVPALGRRLGGEWPDYQFLSRSASGFLAAPGLARLLEAAGFRRVHFRRLALGAVAIHCGCKEYG
jgi:demethylmenaquinone methyltransferase/2-methoxy-6-polyprenyl-1,4-benzoquinol methylase